MSKIILILCWFWEICKKINKWNEQWIVDTVIYDRVYVKGYGFMSIARKFGKKQLM